jgi:four helix bundle protein
MRSHKGIKAWQLARDNALAIHQFIDMHWRPQQAAALDQLRRASLSVQLNIAEGYASGVGARCRFHLRIAYGSSVETTELLEFLEALGAAVTPLIARSVEVQKVTYALWKNSRTG